MKIEENCIIYITTIISCTFWVFFMLILHIYTYYHYGLFMDLVIASIVLTLFGLIFIIICAIPNIKEQ